MSSGTVPAFLSKLWALVENPECDDLICWDLSGKSFHVFDQGRFAKEILPQYFKHSNIASFIRQLNMYGFRKVVNIEQGLKTEKEDLEFQHTYFQRGQEGLLENIKRKVTQQHILPTQVKLQPSVYSEYQTEDIQKVLTDVKTLKGRQEAMNSKLQAMKRENEVLWREVASLRQKHGKQQQIVNKLIQFLVHLAGANHLPSKRKRPLMISDSSENLAKKVPKFSKNLPLTDSESYRVQSPHEQSDILSASSGPIIHDITDILRYDNASSKTEPTFKEEDKVMLGLPDDLLSSPLDPTSSQEIKPEDLNLSLFNAADLFPVKVDGNSSPSPDFNPSNFMTKTQQPGEVVPCSSGNSTSDLMSRVPFKGFDRQKSVSEMSDHVETLQTDLDGLKDVLSNVNYNFDTSTLLNLFNAETPFNLSGGDSILSGLEGIKAEQDNGGNGDDVLAGNEVVQYKTDEPLPDLFDLAELSKEDDVLSSSSVDCFRKQSLETPNPVQISADDLD